MFVFDWLWQFQPLTDFASAPPGRATPLEVLRDFAALVVALSAIYLGVESNDSADKVRQHVRAIVESSELMGGAPGLLQQIQANRALQHMTEWRILYRLGELKRPELLPQSFTEFHDLNFVESWFYFYYLVLIRSNIVRLSAIFFIAIGTGYIWFASLDQIRYFEAESNNPSRIAFIGGVEIFFYVSTILGLIYAFTHVSSVRLNDRLSSIRSDERLELRVSVLTIARLLLNLIPFYFFALVIALSLENSILIQISKTYTSGSEQFIFSLASVYLWAGIVIQIPYFLARDGLVRRMLQEADSCSARLIDRIFSEVASARIESPLRLPKTHSAKRPVKSGKAKKKDKRSRK